MAQPTNAVLEERINSINKTITSNAEASADTRKAIYKKLEEIHSQTKLTNGRVNRHDKELDTLMQESKEAQYQKGKVSVYCWFVGLLTAGLTGAVIKIFFA